MQLLTHRYLKVALTVVLLSSVSAAFAKQYDLVLVHGLANKHKWSSSFLSEVSSEWGSGNVYVIYTNTSQSVYTRSYNGRTVFFMGNNDYHAGKDYIQVQAQNMDQKIQYLKQHHGLSDKFNIIAHSMGGLVSRYYSYMRPNTVAGIVTLGTPNHGSPLADNFNWLANYFLDAKDATDHLRPSYLKNTFNPTYPAGSAPLHDGGRIYTIRGDCDGWDCWGWGGELAVGWNWLSVVHWTDNDGLVPRNNVKISGAIHLADFWRYDHEDLVQKSAVARKAASVLR